MSRLGYCFHGAYTEVRDLGQLRDRAQLGSKPRWVASYTDCRAPPSQGEKYMFILVARTAFVGLASVMLSE
jgi:hypothetical protein